MKKTALITGASLGFGLEFAHIFAREGHQVVLVARNAEKLEKLAQEIRDKYQVKAWVFAKDLSKMEEIDSLYQSLQQEMITIDFLVNNAGFGDFSLFHESEYGKIETMIDLNIKALTKLSHLFVKDMVARGEGKILNVASTAAFQPGPTMAVYYATKAYVLFLGEAMSNELEGTGVTVTTLCPGASETGFQQAANLQESKLVKGKKLPTAREVSEFGYKHLMKGSMTVIPGFMNWLNAQASRFVPRKMVLKIVRMVQDKA
ncbi:SDR family oxidoreductase [Cytophagales bacterium LB-30]|uniref:SDR family oxidoreductase n=1 Tax=Shiella aurantiaca TaxID=3058365 RepID=A0ABT8F3T7_9BACT|nr:SDR family oxidoreductase [Shiella aurantiaca]MDN4165121.1 SDR family oxidoreductase [Shiella aurantiaca]